MYESGWQEEGCVCIACVGTPTSPQLNPAERHEFRLHGSWTGYCICGWVDQVEPQEIQASLTERYREHLEEAANG